MDVYLLLMYFGFAAVVLACLDAYNRVGIKPFALLGVAYLIFLFGREAITILLNYTDMPFRAAIVYGGITNIVAGCIFAVLAVYGITKLIKFFEKGEVGEEMG